MIETGIQGMLTIEVAPQQQELNINQQTQRWTVQMYADRLDKHRDGQYRCMQIGWSCLLQLALQAS